MEEGMLELMWSNHSSIFRHLLTEHREKERYTDATIGCDGKFYAVHKLVLATCSRYFQDLFAHTEGKHPVLLLHDVTQNELEALLCYMYAGSATVSQWNLARFVKVAEALQIKGLAVSDEESNTDGKVMEDASSASGRSPTLMEDYGDYPLSDYRKQQQENSEVTHQPMSNDSELQDSYDQDEEDVLTDENENAGSPNHYSFQGFKRKHNKNSDDDEPSAREVREKIKYLKEKARTVGLTESDKEETTGTTDDKGQHTDFLSHRCRNEAKNVHQKKFTGKNKRFPTQSGSSGYLKGNAKRSLNGQKKSNISFRRLKATNEFGDKVYKCSKCSYKSDYQGIKKHLQTHSLSKSYNCPSCSSSFTRKYAFHRHMKKHIVVEEDERFLCTYCHAKFATKELLVNHRETHDKSKPYSCTSCRTSFSRKDKLTVHMRKHDVEGQVVVSSKSKLTSHKNYNVNDIVFACNDCPATFEIHSQFTEHTQMHAGERQFPCSVCPAAFAKKVHLSRHVLTHKGFGSRDKLQDDD